MPRPKTNLEPPKYYSDITARMRTVIKEWKGVNGRKSQQALSEFLEIGRPAIRHMLAGDRNVSDVFITTVREKLGYNEEWLRYGTGDKKIKKGEPTERKRSTVHDIQKIQQDIEFLQSSHRQLLLRSQEQDRIIAVQNDKITAQVKEIESLRLEISQTLHKHFS